MTTRRQFLQSSALVGFGATVPTFLGRTAVAAPDAATPGAKDTVLVVVQLTGGNDGLNTVIPYTDPEYAKYRPTIGIKKNDVKTLTADIGLHPAMGDLAGLYEDDQLAVLQGIGYPNPSQSHFRSMDIWHAGGTDETLTEGWLGKSLKQKPLPAFHLAADGNDTAPLALTGAPARVPSIASLEDFQLKTAAASAADGAKQKRLIEAVSQGGSGEPDLLDFVRRTAANSYASSDKLQKLGKGYVPKATYPATQLANRLKLAAQLIDGGIGARIFYVSIDGFDTHAGQGGATGSHANLLTAVSGAVAAFYKDVAARGHGDRVCVMTFSEFGRRAKENGSHGTDHGSAAPMFLVGGKVKAGVIGQHPSLTKLDEGNLVHHTDFRRVYASLLTDWLGLDAVKVLGKGFDALPLFG
jgi:uncharacterized protein (DUF1501 family)